MIKPKLKNGSFLGKFQERNRKQIIYINVKAELWESVGLAIHQEKDRTWTISHVQSGTFVLQKIPSRDKAIKYMLELRKLRLNWKGVNEKPDKSVRNAILRMRKQIRNGVNYETIQSANLYKTEKPV